MEKVIRTGFYLLAMLAFHAQAGPSIAVGDSALRHDIQRLADYGILGGPVTTWPLAWGPILEDINKRDIESGLPPDVAVSLSRVRQRARQETETDQLLYRARLSGAQDPARIRSFQNTPREKGEVAFGLSYIGERFSVDLNVSAAVDPSDDKEFRADGSQISLALGNYTIGVSTMDRWWGPGWDGSLILSNNARPIPAITLDRTFTDAFESKWLSWIGPWDFSMMYGQMESDRVVPDAHFFGMRVNFKPIPSLEIGLSRTAQWCGDDRPCGLNTFTNLLLGKDNVGSAGTTSANEPGNQLAGYDFRWSNRWFGRSNAFYGQIVGEDEAGGLPSKSLSQFGAETSGKIGDHWSYRIYGELAHTSCDFRTSSRYNCAYNHGIYQTGYRYRGRVIGHGADNDARISSLGLILIDAQANSYQALVRIGELNRGGAPDARNSLTPTAQDIWSIDISHIRSFRFGRIELGFGYERIESSRSDMDTNDARAFFTWRNR